MIGQTCKRTRQGKKARQQAFSYYYIFIINNIFVFGNFLQRKEIIRTFPQWHKWRIVKMLENVLFDNAYASVATIWRNAIKSPTFALVPLMIIFLLYNTIAS
jgi:hypothetical protein